MGSRYTFEYARGGQRPARRRERVLAFHADRCPVARSIRGSIAITTELEYVGGGTTVRDVRQTGRHPRSLLEPDAAYPQIDEGVLSWSSGKDSAWVLHTLRGDGERCPLQGVRQRLPAVAAEVVGRPI